MGRLIYSMITSVDGYVADRNGRFDDWARPDEEVLRAINEDVADVGTCLYGRRMYEMMAVWETDPAVITQSPESEVFAKKWQAQQKVVYSTTLDGVRTGRTTLLRQFDPEEVARRKASTNHDLTVDGPTLAASALRHGLVDEVHMLLCPVSLGGGLPMLPDARIALRAHNAFSARRCALSARVARCPGGRLRPGWSSRSPVRRVWPRSACRRTRPGRRACDW